MRRELGRYGEELAARYLRQKGYRILERNYYTRYGELDLICENNGNIVFVEVRSKRGAAFGTPEESITPRKMEKIRKTAMIYLSEKNKTRYSGLRFDVITIQQESGKPEIKHFEGAF